jgi:hypothetical protein
MQEDFEEHELPERDDPDDSGDVPTWDTDYHNYPMDYTYEAIYMNHHYVHVRPRSREQYLHDRHLAFGEGHPPHLQRTEEYRDDLHGRVWLEIAAGPDPRDPETTASNSAAVNSFLMDFPHTAQMAGLFSSYMRRYPSDIDAFDSMRL